MNKKNILLIAIIATIVVVIGAIYYNSAVKETDITEHQESYFQCIDENGNVLPDGMFVSMSDFSKQGIAFEKRLFKAGGDEQVKCNFVNYSLDEVTPSSWDDNEMRYYNFNGDMEYIPYTTSIPSDTLIIMDSKFKKVAEVKGVSIEDEYNDMGAYQEGLIKVKANNGLFGFVNGKGEWVIEPVYQDVNSFESGVAAVEIDGLWGGIDTNGNIVIEPKYLSDFRYIGDGDIALVEGDEDKFWYIDKAGNRINDIDYSPLECQYFYSDGLAYVKDAKTGLYGFVDKTGKYVLEPQFVSAKWFENGLAAVSQIVDGKELYGCINQKGELVIDYQFEALSTFTENGLAAAEQEGKWGFVDKSGNWIVEPIYKSVRNYSNGYAIVEVENK